MIRANELCCRFGDFLAVDKVSFDVAQGEIFAFLGPNGAGGLLGFTIVMVGLGTYAFSRIEA